MYFRNQSRSDRDSYVKIIWENIPDDKEGAFKKYSSTVINHFNLRYDFEVRYKNKIPQKNMSTGWFSRLKWHPNEINYCVKSPECDALRENFLFFEWAENNRNPGPCQTEYHRKPKRGLFESDYD